MSRWLVVVLACTAAGLQAAAGPEQGPSTLPASRPTGVSVGPQELRRLVEALGDDDPLRREAAVRELLLADPAVQPQLKEAAMAARPLSPAQLQALSQVAAHLALSEDPYEVELPETGVLGVTMGTEVQSDSDEGRAMGLTEPSVGVPILDRIPGFDSFARLRDGDVVVALPGLPRLTSVLDFQAAVRAQKPGEMIPVTVYREGRRLVIPVRLQPRPAGYQESDWRSQRAARGRSLWEDQWLGPLSAPPR